MANAIKIIFGMNMFQWFKPKQNTIIDWKNLSIEPMESEDDYSPSFNSEDILRYVHGFVQSNQEAVAAYIVRWTQNKPELQARFDLVIGKWGSNARPSDRQMVSLKLHIVHGHSSFEVINADQSAFANSELANRILTREEVVGKEISKPVFAVTSAIFKKDHRLAELRGW
jgi:hypothetical protein